MNIIDYLIPFFSSVLLALLLTPVVRRVALKLNACDRPESAPERKIQKQPVPLLGGIAIFLSVVLVMFFYTVFTDRVLGGYLLAKYLVGLLLAAVFLMIGGFLDDRFNLIPTKQTVWPILAALTVIASGLGVTYVTNPFGGTWYLDKIQWTLFDWGGLPYKITLLADIFTFIWIMGMMYTTKFLDGLDGLVPGIGAIGAIIIFSLSINKEVAQPETALLSIIFAGSCLGFLFFSFHPAKIFLGEGGSLFIGFMLAVLSIISGSKIATALLIMGVPILDVVWVIGRRAFFEKKSPFRTADRKHLHFRLLDIGLSHRQAVVFLYFLSISFGICSLFLKTKEKLMALVILAVVMLVLAIILVIVYKKKHQQIE